MLNTSLLSYGTFAKTLTFPLLKFMSKPTDLKTLLKPIRLKKIQGTNPNPLIQNLALHSQYVQPSSLFFVVSGAAHDGAEFIDEAVSRGAQVIVTEKLFPHLRNILQVQVEDVRDAISKIAKVFYEAPDTKLALTGITGTSGKTTTTWLLRHIYETAYGQSSGLLGSLHYDLGKRILPASRTTPDALSLTSYLDEMVQANCSHAFMEVSSHGIDQKRVAALEFNTAIFTNLSTEHLDYHLSMDAYFEAKKQLFFQKNLKKAVVNSDDPYGQKLLNCLDKSVQVVTFGLNETADIRAQNIELSFEGTHFDCVTPQGSFSVTTKLLGKFNIYNCLAALATCYAQGMDLQQAVSALASFQQVPGRLEKIKIATGAHVFVDFAHKPEALQNVLQTLRELTKKRLVVVFGCGGNRDRVKRPLMGQYAQQYADQVWITSDNPRMESQQQIFEDIRSGLRSSNTIHFVEDRAEAIRQALEFCSADDCLIIAGKGHEQYQEIGQQFYPFDDRKVVETYDQCLRLK